MIVYFDIENFFYRLFDRLDTRIAELHDLTGVRKYDMIVLPVKIRFFVVCLVLAKLVLSCQPAFQKQLYGIVQGSPADPVVLVLHFNIQRLYIKMILAVIYFLENSVTFRGFPVTVVFQKTGEDIFYDLLVLLSGCLICHNEGRQKN